MARCPAITHSGEPCKGLVRAGSDYCPAHDPTRAEARKRSAAKAGRSKSGSEIASVKAQLRKLADDVLAKRVSPGIGSVTSQVLGVWLKAFETELREREVVVREGELALKVREQAELQTRLEELEAAVEATQERARQKGAGNGYTG